MREFIAAILLLTTCHITVGYHLHRDVFGLAGERILLNCTIPLLQAQHSQGQLPEGQVIWLRPRDNVPLSVNYQILNASDSQRMMIVGHPLTGEYHLFIRYTKFPDDIGTWTCTSYSQADFKCTANLTLLVRPPIQAPHVSPDSIEVLNPDPAHSYTFTCMGHFAYPPVQLTWHRDSGPSAGYDVTPPSVLVSRTGTMSFSITLMLRAANAGSMFTCLAAHPTFLAETYRSSVTFVLPAAGALALQSEASMVPMSNGKASVTQLDFLDKAFILIIVGIVLVCFIIGIALNKSRNRWQTVETFYGKPVMSKDDKNLVNGNVITTDSVTQVTERRKKRIGCRLVVVAVVFLVLLTSLMISFPIYYKGVTIPRVSTDELTSVIAGSALWLDCTQLVEPITSLVQVTWYRNDDKLYYQYYYNGQNIGFPFNSTGGFMFGVRVSSQRVGQIALYPVAPGEGGIYSCRVVLSSDNTGTTTERIKTVTVFVLLGPVVNYALLACIALALVAAISLTILAFCHTIRCRSTLHPELPVDET